MKSKTLLVTVACLAAIVLSPSFSARAQGRDAASPSPTPSVPPPAPAENLNPTTGIGPTPNQPAGAIKGKVKSIKSDGLGRAANPESVHATQGQNGDLNSPAGKHAINSKGTGATRVAGHGQQNKKKNPLASPTPTP